MSDIGSEELETQVRFNLRCASYDPKGYYVTIWSTPDATLISVIAPTKQEAINKAARILGEPPRGMRWTFRVEGIVEELKTKEGN